MKSFIGRSGMAALLAVASFGIAIETATPANSGTGTSTPAAERTVEPSFPYVLPLTFEVSRAERRELKSLKGLTVTAQRSGEERPTLVLAPVDPFGGDNQCASPAPAGIVSCAVNGDATVGTLRVNWEVPQAGTYRFVISAKRGGEEQADTIAIFDLEAKN